MPKLVGPLASAGTVGEMTNVLERLDIVRRIDLSCAACGSHSVVDLNLPIDLVTEAGTLEINKENQSIRMRSFRTWM